MGLPAAPAANDRRGASMPAAPRQVSPSLSGRLSDPSDARPGQNSLIPQDECACSPLPPIRPSCFYGSEEAGAAAPALRCGDAGQDVRARMPIAPVWTAGCLSPKQKPSGSRPAHYQALACEHASVFDSTGESVPPGAAPDGRVGHARARTRTRSRANKQVLAQAHPCAVRERAHAESQAPARSSATPHAPKNLRGCLGVGRGGRGTGSAAGRPDAELYAAASSKSCLR